MQIDLTSYRAVRSCRFFTELLAYFLFNAYNGNLSGVLGIAAELSQDLEKSKLKNIRCALSLQISNHIVFLEMFKTAGDFYNLIAASSLTKRMSHQCRVPFGYSWC